MVKELSYKAMSNVLESWEVLRRTGKDYDQKAGTLLFQSLFRNCPEAKPLFGFSIEMDPDSDDMKSSKRFMAHGAYLIQMLDASLNMLGPDAELLRQIMLELGTKHWRFGVTPRMYPIMCESLMDVMTDIIGLKVMTPAVKESWRDVFEALVADKLSAENS